MRWWRGAWATSKGAPDASRKTGGRGGEPAEPPALRTPADDARSTPAAPSHTVSDAIRPVSETLREYGRGVMGGLLFAFAPLYTMEVWWQGFLAPPPILLLALGSTLALLTTYSYYGGVHEETERSWLGHLLEALETYAIGFVLAFVVLKLLGQLPSNLSWGVAVARLTLEGSASAVGVAIGSAQLGADPDGEEAEPRAVIHELAYSVLGGIVIAAGFLSTEEVVTTALEAAPWARLAVVGVSFALALGAVSYLNFRGSGSSHSGVYAAGPLGDAAVTYGLALVLSAGLLWSIGRFDGLALAPALDITVYLAWPTVLGTSVGRLLL